ncbi:MAG: histidine phosphotransferase family protein [Pseudomonadota bacterium]
MSLKSEDIMTLLELLSSRICHDLVSPVGAINNGLEFMEDSTNDPYALKDATELIAHSAASAAARLMAFRLIYGAGGREGNMKAEDIQRAFGALIRSDGKVRQSWDPFGPLGISPATKGYCKTLMGVLVLGQECLPKGGTLYVDAGKGAETLIKAEGTGAVVRDQVEDALAGKIAPAELDPRLIHPYVMGLVAKAYDFNITCLEKTENAVTWSIKQTASSLS